jgi:short-subunit dehydrogenase involved in D-alanine esterification of teichoic acids
LRAPRYRLRVCKLWHPAPIHFSKPEIVNLDVFDQELITNHTSAVRLAKAFIPHLQKQETQTAIMFITSQMALVPMMRSPSYGGASKLLCTILFSLCVHSWQMDPAMSSCADRVT